MASACSVPSPPTPGNRDGAKRPSPPCNTGRWRAITRISSAPSGSISAMANEPIMMRRAATSKGRFTFLLEYASNLTAEERRRLASMLGVLTSELVQEESDDAAPTSQTEDRPL